MSRLGDAIENLYSVFADVRKPQSIDACPCCWDDSYSLRLLSGKLRETPTTELRVFATSAMLTIGTVEDYLYFLPRILDLSVTDPGSMPDIGFTMDAIQRSKFAEWPTPRKDALQRYLSSVIHSLLSPGHHFEINSWVCAIASIGFDVRDHLHAIATSKDAVLAFFQDQASHLPERRLSNTFGELPAEGHDTIVEWFYSPRIRKILFDEYGYVLSTDD